MSPGPNTAIHVLPAYILLTRVGLGCVFLWSGLPKICQPYDFLSSVYSYEIVGPKLGMLVAMTLPWLELAAGVCLVGGVCVSGAFLVSTGMTTVFVLVLASALHRHLNISCGCFGANDESVIDYAALVRASMLLLLSAAGYLGSLALFEFNRKASLGNVAREPSRCGVACQS